LVRLKPAGLGRGKSARSPAKRPVGEDDVLRWTRRVVEQVNDQEPAAQQCSDDELRERTGAYRARLASGETADALLPEAFATVREAARRAIGQRHHDCQIMGGAVLQLGKIAEMRTGEGKTLTATLPAYLAALSGVGVHVMTANAFLAARDCAWMRPVYEFLGLSAGLLETGGKPDTPARRVAYAADVTYGAANEFCYDFLRDNLAWKREELVQRGLHVAIVDEADLILLDEMRTTPQIMGPAPGPRIPHKEFASIAARLRSGVDYRVDRVARTVAVTSAGIDRVEDWFGASNLYDEQNADLIEQLHNALRAKELYARDREYVIIGGQAVPVDEASGRPRADRRLGGGLDEAIEAKEGLAVRPALQVLAVISVRDYLNPYHVVTGMTGTAMSDMAAYRDIYHMDVVAIPTNRPMIRVDHPDVFYRTRESKLAAVAAEARRRQATGQPVLIGTLSADDAQVISAVLSGGGVVHEVLTAANNQREAEILAEAGRPGAVTVVVKMAGRGVDIVLGGATGSQYAAVADAGGLCVLGAERSASRRLELHLRGRAGRQGDPGESRFYLAAEDAIMAAVPRIARPGSSQDGTSTRPLSALIDRTQASTAASQASWLVTSVGYDQVLAEQQRLVYADRRVVLEEPNLRARILRMVVEAVQSGVVAADAVSRYERRETELGRSVMRDLERGVLLSATDRAWREHLAAMTDLRTGLTVRVAGGTFPLAEYRREAARLFDAMTAAVRTQAARGVVKIKVQLK
jgi:preprotein translocase subunit SecA